MSGCCLTPANPFPMDGVAEKEKGAMYAPFKRPKHMLSNIRMVVGAVEKRVFSFLSTNARTLI